MRYEDNLIAAQSQRVIDWKIEINILAEKNKFK